MINTSFLGKALGIWTNRKMVEPHHFSFQCLDALASWFSNPKPRSVHAVVVTCTVYNIHRLFDLPNKKLFCPVLDLDAWLRRLLSPALQLAELESCWGPRRSKESRWLILAKYLYRIKTYIIHDILKLFVDFIHVLGTGLDAKRLTSVDGWAIQDTKLPRPNGCGLCPQRA